MSVTILHLTDIHTGQGELLAEDAKVSVPYAQRQKQLERLKNYVSSLPAVPDFVVVSGDITIRGDRSGLDTFLIWLIALIKAKKLPPAERILLTPGNHDVKRRSRAAQPDKDRYSDFWNVFGKGFPHAHIPDWDPPLRSENFSISKSAKLVGGVKTEKKAGYPELQLKSSLPFVLDLEKDVLIFSFNSAQACGVPLPSDPNIIGPLEAISKLDTPHSGDITKAINAYLDSLVIDAGLIGEAQLQYFSQVMDKLRDELGAQYDRLTKIAFLHHHVTHLWNQALELKTFEAVIDAANLKQCLVQSGFDFVLHGHKHMNHVGIDSALIPISDQRPFTPLCVISGGTIGGHPRMNDRQTFKLLRLEGEKGPRTRATISEIPILENGNLKTAMHDAKIFHAPISQKIPRLHDIPEIKNALDNELKNELAKELNDSVLVSEKTQVDSALSHLVGPTLRYKCHSSLQNSKQHIFYELILATKAISFGDQARLYWLLGDVERGNNGQNGLTRKVVVLIGSLEGTHFSLATKPEEIMDSVTELKQHFQPAIDKGILDIRFHIFKQSEVESITRQAMKEKEK
ncbi:metallophosphoesterase [Paraburkholderia sp. JHI869]|uniref:metallophosphoesterase family protein n=1 Tax=Paraburkholderia sp. JHI869 TaxID=3112959 RepID=UPI0031773978